MTVALDELSNLGTSKSLHVHTGGGGLYKLEFLHFKFCTKVLNAICSVFLRMCAGNNSKRPRFLESNYWEPYIICSLIFLRSGTDFVAPEFVDSYFPPHRIPPPPRYEPTAFSIVAQQLPEAQSNHATVAGRLVCSLPIFLTLQVVGLPSYYVDAHQPIHTHALPTERVTTTRNCPGAVCGPTRQIYSQTTALLLCLSALRRFGKALLRLGGMGRCGPVIWGGRVGEKVSLHSLMM